VLKEKRAKSQQHLRFFGKYFIPEKMDGEVLLACRGHHLIRVSFLFLLIAEFGRVWQSSYSTMIASVVVPKKIQRKQQYVCRKDGFASTIRQYKDVLELTKLQAVKEIDASNQEPEPDRPKNKRKGKQSKELFCTTAEVVFGIYDFESKFSENIEFGHFESIICHTEVECFV
jgi:hypothetical protein